MKKNIHKIVVYILLAAAPLVCSSCIDLSDKILALLNRVTEAEGLVHATNTTINALLSLIHI